MIFNNHVAAPPAKTAVFSLMTYNVLAQMMTKYHGYCPHEWLRWEYRSGLIKKEITKRKPDILCLQELQSTMMPGQRGDLSDDILSWLETNGYEVERMKRVAFNGYQSEKPMLEIALCWNKGTFDRDGGTAFISFAQELWEVCDGETACEHFSPSQVALAQRLKHKATGKTIVASTLHLVSNPETPEVKFAQVQIMVQRLMEMSEGTAGVLLAGDFNSMPDSAVCQFLRDGVLPLSHPELRRAALMKKFGIRMPLLLPVPEDTDTITHPLNLHSAYATVLGAELPLTTTKPAFDGESAFSGTLDYIWHSATLPCLGVLGIPPASVLEQENGGMPCSFSPSDHVPLVANLGL